MLSPGGPAGVAQDIRPEDQESDAFESAITILTQNFVTTADYGPQRYAGFFDNRPEAKVQAFAAVQEFLQAIP